MDNFENFDKKIKSVMNFYAITHKLKNLLRSGPINWKFDAERFESVAEHIYGTQMLSFALNSQFNLGLNIEKVCFMLAFHELGETIIGDISMVEINSHKDKHKMELLAIENLVKGLNEKNKIISLFKEFEARETKEAKFAYMVDKLECELQCKFYDELNQVDFSKPRDGKYEQIRQEALQNGATTISQMWISWDKMQGYYDELFNKLADYIISNNIFENYKSF